MHPYVGLLRTRNFRYFWVGRSIAAVGQWMTHLAVVVFINRVLGTAAAVSLVFGTGIAASLVMLPVAGTLADQVNRRRLIILSDLGVALVFTVLSILQQPALVYAAVFVGGCLKRFADPPTKSILPMLLERGQLRAGNSLLGITYSGALLAGSAIGSFLLSHGANPSVLFLLNGACHLFAAVCTILISVPLHQDTPRGTISRHSLGAFLRAMWSAVPALAAVSPAMRTVATYSIMNAGAGAVNAVLVLVVARFGGASDADVGYVVSAQAAGMMVGSHLLSMVRTTWSLEAVFCGAIAGSGLALVLFSLIPTFLPGLVAYTLVGVFDGIVETAYPTILQSYLPTAVLGRSFGLAEVVTYVCLLVGTSVAGTCADRHGPQNIVLFAGLAIVAVGLVGGLLPLKNGPSGSAVREG